MKNVLIVGSRSYIGDNFAEYVKNEFIIDIIDAVGMKPAAEQFKKYDIVLYVAGIAHRKESRKNVQLYYRVNRDLAIEVARVAKEAGVRQFILMSTMAVYGIEEGSIEKKTKPYPTTHYGKSKLMADRAIWKMRDENFIVAVLRPPMVYGKGCKGNYQTLRSLAKITPIFPKVDNQRSMIYIGNLCEFVLNVIKNGRQGLFFPQNSVYVNPSEMVRLVGLANGNKVKLTPELNFGIRLLQRMPYKTTNKVFGSLVYIKTDIVSKYSFEDSISLTESQLV